LVRDGYRDIVYYRFRLNRSAAGTVRIVNRRGRVVRGFLFSGIEKGTVRWNGRNKYGRKVPTGYYWFKVKAHYQGYRASGGRLAVRVRTGFRYTTHRVSTLGQTGVGPHTGCIQGRIGDSWRVNRVGDPPQTGTVVYTHAFPRRALKGTRGGASCTTDISTGGHASAQPG
jgi:hypothetical protein